MQSAVFWIIANWKDFPLAYVRDIVTVRAVKKSIQKSFKQFPTFPFFYIFKSVNHQTKLWKENRFNSTVKSRRNEVWNQYLKNYHGFHSTEQKT